MGVSLVWKAFTKIEIQNYPGFNFDPVGMVWNTMANGTNPNAKLERNSFAYIPASSHLQYKSLNALVGIVFLPCETYQSESSLSLVKSCDLSIAAPLFSIAESGIND